MKTFAIPTDARTDKPTHIYWLIDPRDETVRYVGKTIVTADERLAGHIYDAMTRKRRRPVLNWVRQLVRAGLRPLMIVVETVPPSENWAEAEMFWIAYARFLGARLVNLSDGGEGESGSRQTPEVVARRIKRGPENARYGKPQKPHIIAALQEGRRKYQADPVRMKARNAKATATANLPENRARTSRQVLQRLEDPAYRSRVRDARARVHLTPEILGKIGADSRARWRENRDAIIAAQNAGKGESFRRKQSSIRKALWQDPDYRRKTSEAHAKKLTPDTARELKELIRTGSTNAALAVRFGVDASLVSHIRSGHRWKHI